MKINKKKQKQMNRQNKINKLIIKKKKIKTIIQLEIF